MTLHGYRKTSASELRRQAIAILRSRMAAQRIGDGRSEREVATYTLPDDVAYPHDLALFRSNPMKEPPR